jgi:hypothetical protein
MGSGERKGQTFGDPHIDVGPGMYDVPSCLQADHLAKSFGISYADYGPLEKELLGRESPGPGIGKLDFGKNLPQYRFSGASKMGSGSRPKPKRNTNPPPGAYNAHKQYSVAKGKCIDSQVWNYPAHNFGKPSMKPRLDLKQMKMWSEIGWAMN